MKNGFFPPISSASRVSAEQKGSGDASPSNLSRKQSFPRQRPLPVATSLDYAVVPSGHHVTLVRAPSSSSASSSSGDASAKTLRSPASSNRDADNNSRCDPRRMSISVTTYGSSDSFVTDAFTAGHSYSIRNANNNNNNSNSPASLAFFPSPAYSSGSVISESSPISPYHLAQADPRASFPRLPPSNGPVSPLAPYRSYPAHSLFPDGYAEASVPSSSLAGLGVLGRPPATPTPPPPPNGPRSSAYTAPCRVHKHCAIHGHSSCVHVGRDRDHQRSSSSLSGRMGPSIPHGVAPAYPAQPHLLHLSHVRQNQTPSPAVSGVSAFSDSSHDISLPPSARAPTAPFPAHPNSDSGSQRLTAESAMADVDSPDAYESEPDGMQRQHWRELLAAFRKQNS